MTDARQSIVMAFRGSTFHGSWYVRDGEVCVDSAYGHRRAQVSGDDRHTQLLAELLFRQLVRGSRAAQRQSEKPAAGAAAGPLT